MSPKEHHGYMAAAFLRLRWQELPLSNAWCLLHRIPHPRQGHVLLGSESIYRRL